MFAQATCTQYQIVRHCVAPMAPKSPMKKRSGGGGGGGAGVWWNFFKLGRLIREGAKHDPSNNLETIAYVVAFDHLPHGPHAQVNLLARGNECFRLVGPKGPRTLKAGSIYKVHVNYDDDDGDDDDDDVIDEFSVGTISYAQYLGTAESITVASNRMTKKVAKYVAEMVSFNTES